MTQKKIRLAPDFVVDAVEYASRANAILGIRDSGKTYTATLIAEQLYSCHIPFFAFDPIGRWRFLRSPAAGNGVNNRGFPVVVVGGKQPDLEVYFDQYPRLIGAAMDAGVSMVIDLYDMKLSKKEWRAIVRTSIATILYENEERGGGLRHVFLEEAAEFVPQRVYDGQTYAAIEKLVRMGGNAGVGVTLINQRAEEVNKAVLELADNLLLHRQRGKNSLLSLRKWLEAGNVTPPREITDSLADLPTGQCWAWFKDVGKPRLIQVAAKRSFDPNRREMAAGAVEGYARVNVDDFVADMTRALGRENVKPQEDPDVKESEAKALRAENSQLKKQVEDLAERVEELSRERPMTPVNHGKPVSPLPAPNMDSIYAEIKRRLLQEPSVLRIALVKPEIEISVKRVIIEANDQTLYGKVAHMVSEGFFDDGQTGHATFEELKRRGNKIAKPSVYRECDKLASQGFLTKESSGYKTVPAMKVNIVEAA